MALLALHLTGSGLGVSAHLTGSDLDKRIHPDSVSQAMPRFIASANAARAAARLEPMP